MSHFVVAVFSHEPDQVDELLAPYIESVDPDSCFAEFVEDDEHDLDETTGKRGFWHNPNARWDWYTVGGRWRGLLQLQRSFQPAAGREDRQVRIRLHGGGAQGAYGGALRFRARQ